MPTLSACPACHTAMLPGGAACLRCGHAVDQPVRPCLACRRPARQDARYCAGCGAALDVAAPPASTGTPGEVDVADVFPEPPSYRRPVLVVLAVLGVLVLGLTIVDVVEWRFFRPQATVTAYFDALAERDGAAAGRLLAGGGGEMLDAAALRSDDYTPPSDVQIDSVDTEDDRAAARVTFMLGDQRQEMTMSLVRAGHHAAGLFPRWRIADGTFPVSVYAPGVDSVVLAGVPLALGEDGEAATVQAFPGAYVSRLPQQPLLVAEPVTVHAGEVSRASRVSAEITPTVAPGARAEVERQVREYLDRCAKQTVLSPEDCPFSTYSYGDADDVRWKITSYPSIAVEVDPYTGAVAVRTEQSGVAVATWREVYVLSTYQEEDQVRFTVRGSAAASGGTITFTPSTGY